ncbi:PREDICTED: uromodulin-like [Acropora digitifera]|uniref:uromodulin-like n=1 Tax=Acropora digitifera TaxID=70779 RepID=UPI00077A2FEC|nr:PREDICTED: uromodulin-like [Acropora digitifera]
MQLLKIILLLSVFVFSPTLATKLKDPDKVVSRDGPNRGVSYVNFVEEKFSYLNITALGRDFVDSMPDCSFACLGTPLCFSFNLGTIPDVNDSFRCELLPSDKYNNSDKFVHSLIFHHFSIATPCRNWPCQNNGKCLPVYEVNDYKCICNGFKGKNCEDVIPECKNYIAINTSDRNLHSTRGRNCDDNLKTGWYRFQGQAGKQLAIKCPPIHRCTTDMPGWMNGNHPNVEDGIVERQVCFHGYSNCCHRTTTIDVRNCGAYFVYRLTKVSNCMSRYCGTG